MMAIAVRLLIFVAVVYLGLCAIIYFRQDRFIYPAPRTAYDPAPGYAAVQLTTADGLTLAAHWRAPDTDRPVVVHFHGNGGSLDGAIGENRVFADRGFGVLLVEYRGYGGNPGSPGEAGFYADGRAAMEFLQNRAIPMDRTILKGHSIGTGTAQVSPRRQAPSEQVSPSAQEPQDPPQVSEPQTASPQVGSQIANSTVKSPLSSDSAESTKRYRLSAPAGTVSVSAEPDPAASETRRQVLSRASHSLAR